MKHSLRYHNVDFEYEKVFDSGVETNGQRNFMYELSSINYGYICSFVSYQDMRMAIKLIVDNGVNVTDIPKMF